MKYPLILLICGALTLTAAARDKIGAIFGSPDRSGDKAAPVRTFVEDRRAVTSDRWSPDTVYFSAVERRFDWFEGVGKALPMARAQHAGRCFRLTRRTPLGQYLRVESLVDGKPAPADELRQYSCSAHPDCFVNIVDQTNYFIYLHSWPKVATVELLPTVDGGRVQMVFYSDAEGNPAGAENIERVSDYRSVVSPFGHDGATKYLTVDADSDDEYILMLLDYDSTGKVEIASPADKDGILMRYIYFGKEEQR